MMLTWFKDWLHKPTPTLATAPPLCSASSSAKPTTHPGLMRRQLVLDHHLRAHAYALSLRHLPQATHANAHLLRNDEILLCEVSLLLAQDHAPQRPLWLELEWESLASSRFSGIQTDHALTLLARGRLPSETGQLIHEFKQHWATHTLGCTYDVQLLSVPHLGEQIQLIHIQIADADISQISQLIQKCHQFAPNAKIWADGVNSQETAEACIGMGINFVSGAIFSQPPQLGGHLPASFMRLNQALQQAQAGAPFADIAETIRVDPALSTRLLRYVNSAALGLNHPINYLIDALNVLGQQRLYRWLALLLFNPSDASPLDDTLLEAALTRARLMELLGQAHLSPAQCELLFLTGLFSLLDYLLRVPRSLLLSELKMPELVAQTLAGSPTVLTPYLNLAIQSEQGELPDATLLQQCHCDASHFNQYQLDATMWVLTTLSS